ncbi:MAG: hypothetical protein LBP22_04145 [Deltaproteobacteria bacterium]|jgi:hypothetical protein|nr:hypothetical protein [Deltaproteobacteria bacterium]
MKEWKKYLVLGIVALLGMPLLILMWSKDGPRPDEPAPRTEAAVLDKDAARTEAPLPPGLVEMEFFDRQTPGVCALPGLNIAELPEDAVVYAVSVYGGQELGWPLDRISGHEGHLIKVAVNSPERPVLLMLGTYEPTVWRIEWTEGTRILGVMVSGYHSQFVSGLPPRTPMLISSYDQKQPGAHFYVSALAKKNPADFADLSRTLFGRAPETVVPTEKGLVHIGPEPPTSRPWVSAAPWRPEDFQLSGPLPGKFGLNQAVAAGLIRPALVRDQHQWQLAKAERERAAALAEGLPEKLIPPPPEMRGSGDQPLHQTYVVLSPDFVLPNGLYGGNSAFFLLPPGVPLPQGDLGHSQFRFMEDGRSLGPHPDER